VFTERQGHHQPRRGRVGDCRVWVAPLTTNSQAVVAIACLPSPPGPCGDWLIQRAIGAERNGVKASPLAVSGPRSRSVDEPNVGFWRRFGHIAMLKSGSRRMSGGADESDGAGTFKAREWRWRRSPKGAKHARVDVPLQGQERPSDLRRCLFCGVILR